RSDEEKARFAAVVGRAQAGEIRVEVERSALIARGWLQDQLLAAWPDAVTGGREEAAGALLAGARPVADALLAATGARFMSEADAATPTASRDRARRLASARRTFRTATDIYNDDRVAESMSEFRAALAPLDEANDPFAVWTRLFLATGTYYSGNPPRAAD